MKVSFSIVRPYCNSLTASGFENLHEQWYWVNIQLQSGVRIRPYLKDGEYIVVVTEFSKNPLTHPNDLFNRIIEYIVDRIAEGWSIDKIVFQKGGILIPSWFIDFLNEQNIKLILISDNGNGIIVEEELN